MLNTSAAFKTAIDAPARRTEAFIAIHFGGKQRIPTASATSQQDATTSPAQAAIGRIRANEYSSTGLHASYADRHKGWWSLAKADASGTFATPQQLTMDYGEVFAHKNFWFVADSFYYPVDFDVLYTDNTVWSTLTTVTGNTNPVWSYRAPADINIKQVRLVVRKVSRANEGVRILHFGAVTTVLYEKEDIIDFSLLEETKSETTNPVGTVTSNEFSLTLDNSNRWYAVDNIDSPFYGLIKPKIPIEPYIGVETSSEMFEYVGLGKFKILDWDAPSSSIESSLVAYDKLYDILNKEIPMKLPMRNGTTLKDLFIYLFQSLGLSESEYQIDDSISFPITIGWLPQGLASASIQTFSEAGNCSVFVNREDVIRVRNNRQSGVSVASLTDDNQIISIDNPQRLMNTYPTVKVDYSICYLGSTEQVARLDKIIVPPGPTSYRDISFSLGPVGNVVYVNLIGAKTTKVAQISMGAFSMDLELNNSGATEEEISVEVHGKAIKSNTVQKQAVDLELSKYWEDKTLRITSPFIQDELVAQDYCDSLLEFVRDPQAYYTLSLRANPSLELLDLVDVQSDTDAVGPAQVAIIRNQITYNGGLEGTMYARKVIT